MGRSTQWVGANIKTIMLGKLGAVDHVSNLKAGGGAETGGLLELAG